ncbi:glutaredoxin [Scheffersomyces spartinae]|uniref:Glutaredoxin n=1 Tax=Scheffersomyces spartinae TaxID=45513 RepID=A0A9P7VB59_9ASCO|nr:glutaredoxin [Scheffersomyces spartinae]KAG7194768.1 glutaredoxin [Scheffersomyces spartinae]
MLRTVINRSNYKFIQSRSYSNMVSASVKARVDELIKKPVFVASKTYCPYCKAAKATLGQMIPNLDDYIIELDTDSDGEEIQEYLRELTGQRTVPNIMVGGEHLGGNSDIQALNLKGSLKTKIKAAL